jgi:hypothetical protein
MPFVGEKNGSFVVPTQVEDSERCTCPVCKNELGVRSAYYRDNETVFVARHFFHLVDTDCEGESDEHLRMKAIAHSKLEEEYPEAKIEFEEKVEGSGRRADVLVTFQEPRGRFGEGIAVEVQYMNKQKEIDEVESDYLKEGYSVLWLYEEDFSGKNVSITEEDVLTVYPNVISSVDTERYYPETPEPTEHEEKVKLSLEGIGSMMDELLAESWLEGRVEHVREKAEGNYPEKNGKWQSGITRVRTVSGASMSLDMAPEGGYILKATNGEDTLRLSLSVSDSSKFRKNAKKLCTTDIFGISEEEWRDLASDWVDLTKFTLRGGRKTTSWVNISVSPSGEPVLTVGKKSQGETELVHIGIYEEDVSNLIGFFVEVVVLLSERWR